VPVLLEIGREPVHGEARDALLEEAAGDLLREAMGDDSMADGLIAGGSA
jgi:ATP-dependent Lhr-like helicase